MSFHGDGGYRRPCFFFFFFIFFFFNHLAYYSLEPKVNFPIHCCFVGEIRTIEKED